MSNSIMMTRRSNLIVLCIISMVVMLVPIGGVKISHLQKQTYVYNSLSAETIAARQGTNPPREAALEQERTKRMATLTDIPFAQVILPKGNKPYWLKKGAVVSHATAFPFITFKDHSPTWFSPDPTEGLRLIIGNELQTQAPRDIFIKRCTVQRDVALFSMSPTDQESMDRLLALGMTEDDFVSFDKNEQNGPKLKPMGGWYAKTAADTDRFISNFCAKLKGKFEGWRNAFDQDEIMICDEINAKVQCSTQIPSLPPTTKSEGWICPATRPGVYEAGPNGAINTNALKTVGYSQLILRSYSPRARPATSHPFFMEMIKDQPTWFDGYSQTRRMTYAVVPITQHDAFYASKFDHQASMDQSGVILTEICTFTEQLNIELTRRMNGGLQVFQDAAVKGARQGITSKRWGNRAASNVQLRPVDTVDKSQNFLKEIKRTAASASMLPSCDYEANPQGPPVLASTPRRAVAVLLANARDPTRAQRIICYVPRTPNVILTVGALKVSVESAYRSFINDPKANLDGWFTSLTDPKLKGLQFPIYRKHDPDAVGSVIYGAKQ